MSEYNVLEDKESYKNIYGPVLLIARIMLMILIIVMCAVHKCISRTV